MNTLKLKVELSVGSLLMACLLLRKGSSQDGDTSQSVNVEISKEAEGELGERRQGSGPEQTRSLLDGTPSPSISFLEVTVELKNKEGHEWERDLLNNTAYYMQRQKSQFARNDSIDQGHRL